MTRWRRRRSRRRKGKTQHNIKNAGINIVTATNPRASINIVTAVAAKIILMSPSPIVSS